MLTIQETRISRNENGLYSLNDLHRAAGGEKRHSPSYWLKNQQTVELIDFLAESVTGIPVTVSEVNRGGRDQGTFVCKKLVYAYAMWISPRFMSTVIDVFDAVSTGDVESALRYANTTASQMRLEKLEQEKQALLSYMDKKLLSPERQDRLLETIKRLMVKRIKGYLQINFVKTVGEYEKLILCATDYEPSHEPIAVEVLESLVIAGVVERSSDGSYSLA